MYRVVRCSVNPTLYTNGFSHLIKKSWDSPLYNIGVPGYNLQKKYFLLSQDMFYLILIKYSIELHFIWVFTVCKSTRLGVSRIQRVNMHTVYCLHCDNKVSKKAKIGNRYKQVPTPDPGHFMGK